MRRRIFRYNHPMIANTIEYVITQKPLCTHPTHTSVTHTPHTLHKEQLFSRPHTPHPPPPPHTRSEKPQLRMAGSTMAHIRIHAYTPAFAGANGRQRQAWLRRLYQGLRIMPFFPIVMCGP